MDARYLLRWAGLLEARMMDRSSVEHGVWAADETEFSSVVMSEGAEISPRVDCRGSSIVVVVEFTL